MVARDRAQHLLRLAAAQSPLGSVARSTKSSTAAPSIQAPTPEELLIEQAGRLRLRDALEALPLAWREILVLRELEGMSYKEIADVTGIKMGTVMSRLARARAGLQQQLAIELEKG